MTMLSFRVSDGEAAQVRRWAETLDLDRSELLRDALNAHLARLRAEADATSWHASPASEAELSLGGVSEWGPAEDWADWVDATG